MLLVCFKGLNSSQTIIAIFVSKGGQERAFVAERIQRIRFGGCPCPVNLICRPTSDFLTGVDKLSQDREISEDLKLIVLTKFDFWGRVRIVISFLTLFLAGIGFFLWFILGLVGWVYRAYLKENRESDSG